MAEERTAPMPTPTRDSKITLREITDDTVRPICRLSVHSDQKSFVADNATSIAQAHFAPHAWFRRPGARRRSTKGSDSSSPGTTSTARPY
jgi:hypothetical protein